MTVRLILDDKGRDVATVDPSMTIDAAVKLLAERRIGALVAVGEGGSLLGIFSERDIVRLFAAEGAAALERNIGSAMTRDVKTATEETTVDQAMEIMTRNRFRHLPVVDGDRLVGIISIGDVVKRRIGDVEREAEDLKAYIHAG